MSYTMFPVAAFLGVLLAAAVAVIADGSIRLLRGQILRLRAIALALRGR